MIYVVVHERLRAALCRHARTLGGGVWGPGLYWFWIERPNHVGPYLHYAIFDGDRLVSFAQDMDT